MSKKTFHGRVVIAGEVSGDATVSRQAFNTSGSYLTNMAGGNTETAPCTDNGNPELRGKEQKGSIRWPPLACSWRTY